MAAHIYPADSVDTNADGIKDTPSYTGRWLRQTLVAASTAMQVGTRPLGTVSGVRPGTPNTIVTATSATWTVTPFMGVLDGEAAAIAGGYEYAFDANVTGSVTAAGASARTDRLDVQVSDAAESDGTGATTPPTVTIVYTIGGPGLAAAPARSHPLAQINVPATGGGSPTVTWSASYFAAPGGVVPFTTLTLMRAWNPPTDGQLAYAQDENSLWIWLPDASTPAWYHVGGSPHAGGGISYAGIYSAGSPAPAVTQSGSRVYLEGLVVSSSATFVAGTTYTVGTIPLAFGPATDQKFGCTANNTAVFSVTVAASTGTVTIIPNVGFTGALSLSLAGFNWKMKGM